MINLMPVEAKTNILYARRNTHLAHWTVGSLMIILAMAATVVLGGFYIDSSKQRLSNSITSTQDTITTQKLDETQKEAENISGGVKLIVQVLSKEILFSKLLQQLGTLMPAGATLGDVQLSSKIDGALDLTANAVSQQAATQVQLNLQDSKNNLFDKVDAISVTCADKAGGGSADPRYKCQIVLRAQFKPSAGVTFLASPNGAKP